MTTVSRLTVVKSRFPHIILEISLEMTSLSGNIVGIMNDFLLAGLPMLLVASLATVILLRMFPSTLDPQEPPLISASIPYIGHIIGMMRSKFNYHVQLR